MLGWYFAQPNNRLGHGDDREIRVGETHYVNGAPKICRYGLHASRSVLDALQYAPSNTLYRVRLGGWKDSQHDKHCAQSRTYLAVIDAEEILRRFACECALDVVHMWDAPEVVLDYLRTGDKSKRYAAKSAAKSAASAAANVNAWSASWSATKAASRSVVWYAARSAAGLAASSAAGSDTGSASWSATRAAARAAQNRQLEQMCLKAIDAVMEKDE
jgi:hypothetical protein